MLNTIEHMETCYNSIEDSPDYIDTDFCHLRFHRGDLIVLAARPSIGKTSFAFSLGNHVALNKNIPVGYISLGCDSSYFDDFHTGAHFLSIELGISTTKIRNCMFTDSDFQKIKEAAETLSEAHIYLINEPNSSFDTLERKAKTLIKEKQVQLIIINGFESFEELVDSEKKDYRLNLEIILERLKTLAMEQHVPIIFEMEIPPAESDTEPSLRDFKKYMIIPTMADMVLFLHRDSSQEDYEKQDAELIVLNKNGWSGCVCTTFDPATTAFGRRE